MIGARFMPKLTRAYALSGASIAAIVAMDVDRATRRVQQLLEEGEQP